jgi:hypothetical protein
MNSELLKRLDILADKLGSTAGQLWNSLLLGLCAGYSIPSELFNPEYFALHQILSMLGGK